MSPIHSRLGSTSNASSRAIFTVAMICIGLFSYVLSGVSPAIAAPQGKPDKVTLIVKTAKGLPLAQAQADMSTIAARLSEQYREKNAGHGVKLEPLTKEEAGRC